MTGSNFVDNLRETKGRGGKKNEKDMVGAFERASCPDASLRRYQKTGENKEKHI